MDSEKGFILTRNCIDISGHSEIHIFCNGERGGFQIIHTPYKPLFFIEQEKKQFIHNASEIRDLDLTTFQGKRVCACYFRTKNNRFKEKRRLKELEIPVFESDVKPAERFCMERHLKGGLKISGKKTVRNGIPVYINPELKPTEYKPRFNILSLDIETGRDNSLHCIGCHIRNGSSRRSVVFMNGTGTDDDLIQYAGSEKDVLLRFIDFIRSEDPDIIIGWHVIGFDLRFLENKCIGHSIRFSIGRAGGPVYFQKPVRGPETVSVPGRIVIDGPGTLRMGFYSFDDYSLDSVANELLGTGKDISDEENKVREIERRYREDKKALAKYNILDCTLTADIFEKTELLEQLYTRSCITGLQIDKVYMSVASFDYFMLPQIHRKGFVAPDTDDVHADQHAAGGYVFSSDPGLYENIVILDFKSLYPTIIRTFRIDPYSLLKNSIDGISTPSGHRFSSTQHILPGFLEELMEKRSIAKKQNKPYMSQAIKILMNSFYGVMGTPGCRFYHPFLPSAITETGQWILKESSAFLQTLGYSVLYGDTDSLFIRLKEGIPPEGSRIEKKINEYWDRRLEKEFNVKSYLEMEYEKTYVKLFLPPIRGTNKGATKRYAGMLQDRTIELKGLEYVRSDWTELARDFQYRLFERYFNNQELKEWIREYVGDIRNGRYDDKLVYRRRLTKSSEEYTKNIPPHVKAARMLESSGKKVRFVKYIITENGPEPVEILSGNIDYSHYIEKQIKPLADSVLSTMNESFDEIILGKQLDLFNE